MWLDQRDIALEEIEQPAQLALNISVETVAPLQTLRSLLNMAELRLLQGDRSLALAFWRECVDACVFRSLSLSPSLTLALTLALPRLTCAGCRRCS